MDSRRYILGCLLGTALGDAVGLLREGLSRRRALKIYGGSPLMPSLVGSRGLCSDDTEHTQMVGRALVLSAGDVDKFEREMARQLKCWLLTVPAGVGMATLKSCVKLLVGFSPRRSGVFSAGNGPAMRSALLGVWAESDSHLKALVHRCTRLTHTDPRAEEGALLVARAARLTAHKQNMDPAEFLALNVDKIVGDEMRDHLRAARHALANKKTPQEFANSRGWSAGVSGYVNQTVPAALYCWASSPSDFRQCVETAVLLGGDSDSVAAIAGAISGANLGHDRIPQDWLDRLAEWPRSIAWMQRLAESLTQVSTGNEREPPPSMHWLLTLPRNLVFTTIVLGLGFRRLFPPY